MRRLAIRTRWRTRTFEPGTWARAYVAGGSASLVVEHLDGTLTVLSAKTWRWYKTKEVATA